ncbi:hypothetical protein SRB5_43390 [Streptomyces sp. RB5]|uniref:ABC transporter permease n=1 Tax=Streptomyces smaragdinus TaxID=2585196 RepID=A0A7K0CL19_9ACTN|nr:ABC transporter permease [Streptomyces smaragdinus]MQY14177.1 hypothetical protein [Streptomyces smaragdinus]
MTTVTSAPRTAAARDDSHRPGAFAGTRTLIRFNLRRDRIRIPVWVLALFVGTVSTIGSFTASYGTPEDVEKLVRSMDSPAALAMTGPRHYLDDYNIGAMLGHQMLGFTAVMVGIMSVLFVTRYTRAEEETGRAELVRSTVVGRHAHLAAALAVTGIANAAHALLLFAGLAGNSAEGIDVPGSLLYAVAHFAIGMFFAAVAAVTVQFTAHSRGASGMAMAVVGAAYGLRAAGDVGNGVLSWLSPIGWVQRTYVYVDNNWLPVLLTLAVAAALAYAGFRLSLRRDVGAGLRPDKRGAGTGSRALTSPLGFAVRLHRGLFIGFGIATFVLGVMYGSIIADAEDMVGDVKEIQEALEELGGATVAESFASIVMIVIAIVSAVYVVMAALRARAEETAGRAEPLLATGLSRTRWLGSHIVVAAAGGTATLLLAGLGFGIAGAGSTGDGGMVLKLTGAALAFAPALWVTVGVAVLLFGWLPRATAAAWLVPVYAFVVGYLGQILQFPDWTNNLSPFGHVPQLPAEDMSWTPLLLLTLVAGLLIWAGLVGFNRRDLETK